MMSIATFAPSLLLITGARCAALWSAAWTSLDYKGRHAGNVAQSTAGLWRGNMSCECSSCVMSRHRTPAAAWTSRPMRGRLLSAAAIGPARWFLAGSGGLCRGEKGKEQRRIRLRSIRRPAWPVLGERWRYLYSTVQNRFSTCLPGENPD